MKNVIRSILPLLIIAAAGGGFSYMLANKKAPPRVDVHVHRQSVKVMTAAESSVAVVLPSQGILESQRTTMLASEVAGRVIKVSPKFFVGELFEEGETLVELDSADYEAAFQQAEATLADAKLAEASEKAKAEQAIRDWQKLGGTDKPNDLALRKPHLESAAARIKAAEAALVKARRDVTRTAIKAPFRGRLRSKATEIGSILAPGARVAEIYSVGAYEVRLPLSLDDYAFLEDQKTGGKVTLHAAHAGQRLNLVATIKRIEGEVDRASRSVYVVAEISEGKEATDLIKPGLFVKADVEGRTLAKVIRVPRRAFLDERRLLVVTPDNKISFREVEVLRGDSSDLFVHSGLKAGERVVVTALGSPVEGMNVEVLADNNRAGGNAP